MIEFRSEIEARKPLSEKGVVIKYFETIIICFMNVYILFYYKIYYRNITGIWF